VQTSFSVELPSIRIADRHHFIRSDVHIESVETTTDGNGSNRRGGDSQPKPPSQIETPQGTRKCLERSVSTDAARRDRNGNLKADLAKLGRGALVARQLRQVRFYVENERLSASRARTALRVKSTVRALMTPFDSVTVPTVVCES
jgi:hypothetical protein